MPPKKLSLSTPSKKKPASASKTTAKAKRSLSTLPSSSFVLVPPSVPRSPAKKRKEKKEFFTPSPSKKLKDAQTTRVTPSPKKDQPPQKKSRKGTSSITSTTTIEASKYVPTAIYKNIQYLRRSNESLLSLSVPRRKALSAILEVCTIPDDLETRKYGPLSGMCWEERVITCYDNNMLEGGRGTMICTECGEEEKHRRNTCPTLL